MAPLHALEAEHLDEVLARVHAALAAHRTEIDALNVFPVPDGDTGTNLVMTARAALDAFRPGGDAAPTAPGAPPAAAQASPVCAALTHAAMRGARGNSGVIFSQVLRALAETVAEHGRVDARTVATFLARARELAYEAVAEPVEGTILTAITVAAETARHLRDGGATLAEITAAVHAGVHAAVVRSREQLAVLREAGVVDAGARGFEVVVEALHAQVTGAPFEATGATASASAPAPGRRSGTAGHDRGPSAYRFEVQYLLDSPDEAAPRLRRRLETLGDSVVVVAADGLTSVHVHTDEVGAVIEEGLRLGRPSRIEVVSFADQLGSQPGHTAGQQCAAAGAAPGAAAPRRTTQPRLACVVVLPGSGLRELAEELGAVVVPGGAGMLPSVADLLNAIGDVSAERVVILPGHRNAVPTASQASGVSVAEGGRVLSVVEQAETAPAVLAALAVYEPDGDPAAVLADMEEAAAGVRAGEVVPAVRAASTPIGEVADGQFLAVVDGEVTAASDDPLEALGHVAGLCRRDGCELVTLVLGADVDADEADRAEQLVRSAADDLDVEVVLGRQRPARYFLGVQ